MAPEPNGDVLSSSIQNKEPLISQQRIFDSYNESKQYYSINNLTIYLY